MFLEVSYVYCSSYMIDAVFMIKAKAETKAIISQHVLKPNAEVKKPPSNMPITTPTEKMELSIPDALLASSSSIVLSFA